MPTSDPAILSFVVTKAMKFKPKSVLDVGCVSGETKVMTSEGIKRIKSIRDGNQVLTHKGTFESVAKVFRRGYKGKIVELKTNYETIEITPEHPVYLGKGVWKEAGNVKKGEFLAYPIIKNKPSKITLILDLKKTHTDTDKIKAIKLYQKIHNYAKVSKILHIPKTSVRRWCVDSKENTRDSITNRKLNINKNIARLIGYYLAEGSSNDHHITLSFNNKGDLPYIEDTKKIVKEEFGVGVYNILMKNGVLSTEINLSALARCFKINFGNKSYNKKLPSWYLRMEKGLMRNVIIGMWRGDGCMSRTRFDYTTTSEELVVQLRNMLLILGIKSYTNYQKPNLKSKIPKVHGTFNLRVGGKDLAKMSRLLGMKHPYLSKRNRTFELYHIDNNFLYTKILKTEKKNYDGNVYNLNVYPNNSYCSLFFTLHNCGMGKYGMLLREYLEVWQNQVLSRMDWKTKIDGVEIFRGYENPIHIYAYDMRLYDNIMKHLDMLKNYDLILLIDVIEHIKRDSGERLLESIPGHYILSTPNGYFPQGEVFGNKREAHISCWTDYNFPNKRIIGTQILAWK